MIWFMKLIRILLAAIDIVVYWLLELVYSLFIAISSAGIFSQATIQSFATRIYVFLGLIMVFKVSISLVTYIMNPDNFSKGDVGAPALLKGFIFALVGIVLVPYVFEIAYSFQRVILKQNVIGNLILGMGHDENSEFSENFIKSGGKNMADTVYNAFYRPNEKLVGDECLADPGDCDMSEYFEADVLEKYEKAYGEEDGAPLSVVHRLDWDILNATYEQDGETVFVMDYTYLITTLIGGFITYILFLFCIDIAVRSVKLCFLQLIAPIPLISKVDPKKGDKVFGNWMKECTSTYLDVFMRLLAIYFALFIISSISLQPINMVEGGTFDGFLGLILAVFLIIGTLNFARELPKLIGGIFGIDFKGMGGFTLNPAKKFGATPILGAMGGNLVRKTAAGLDAMKNLDGNFNSFRTGWNKESANDKGFIADMKRYNEKLHPYSTGVKKANLENREKYLEHEADKEAGRKLYESIEAQKKAYKDKNGVEMDKATIDETVAKTVFEKNPKLQKAYQTLNAEKRERDSKQSTYEKLRMSFDRGDTNVTADQVDDARIAAAKASSQYDKHSSEFKTMLADDTKSSKAYAQYSLYDDNAALYENPQSAADVVTYGNATTSDVNNHIAGRVVSGHPEDHNITPPPPTGGGGGNPPMGGNPRL